MVSHEGQTPQPCIVSFWRFLVTRRKKQVVCEGCSHLHESKTNTTSWSLIPQSDLIFRAAGFSRTLVSTSYTSTHCEISFDANQIFTDVYHQTPAWTSKFHLFNRLRKNQDCKLHLSRQIWGWLCPFYAANYITQ